jgi:predicted kinase
VRKPHLIIVCGVPGSGKSTFAHRVADRWGATSFASETFADKMGAAARTASGDLSKEAIVHAYAAMEAAAAAVLKPNKLVLAVGSFRAEQQRSRFRELAVASGASAITIRVTCPVAVAAERVRARIALGERGPGEEAIRQIDAELDRATGIDEIVTNEASIESFHRQIDALIQVFWVQALRTQVLDRDSDRDAPTAAIVQDRQATS